MLSATEAALPAAALRAGVGGHEIGAGCGRSGVLLPRRISAADLAAYRRCPRTLYFEHIARVRACETRPAELMLDTVIHATLERFFGLPTEAREPAKEVLERCLRAEWRERRKAGTFATVEEEAAYGQRALTLIRRFAGRFDTRVVPLARARQVTTRLSNGVELFGNVDRVDGLYVSGQPTQLEIVDYRTDRHSLASDEVGYDLSAKVGLLAVEWLYGRLVQGVRHLYLPQGRDALWTPDRQDVDAAHRALVALSDSVYGDREFKPTPGPHCRFCPFAHVCPDAGPVSLDELVAEQPLPF